MRKVLKVFCFTVSLFLGSHAYAAKLTAMAPLLVEQHQWGQFEQQLKTAKQAGVQAINVDVWWGLVQKDSPQSFDWSYYHRLFSTIRKEGLQIAPKLSIHACGGNVGDNVNIPVPEWIWQRRKHGQQIHFVSESGALNRDFVSYWATDVVIEDYKNFWREFQKEYRHLAPHFSELSISMGASGELHYPSYHGHDADQPLARWPHRGLFQAYGPLAERDLQQQMVSRYGTVDALNRAWGTSYRSFLDVRVPYFNNTNALSQALNGPWSDSVMAKDILNWYHDTMVGHARSMMEAAHRVFQSPLNGMGVPLSLKIPGIHWDQSGQAELTNGLLTQEEWKNRSRAYNSLFSELRSFPGDFSVYTTAAATANTPGPHPPFSRAEDLVRRVEESAMSNGVALKVENALAGDLYNPAALSVLETHLDRGNIQGVTLLRVTDVAKSPEAQRSCSRMLLRLFRN